MIALRRILVPTDFSKSSQNALTYAAAFAEKFGAELHLLHVVQDLALFIPEAVSVAPPIAPPVEQMTAAVREALDRLVAENNLGRFTVRLSKWDGAFDLGIIDGLANLSATVTQATGGWLRRSQTGYLRSYVLFLVLAAVGIWVILSSLLAASPAVK